MRVRLGVVVRLGVGVERRAGSAGRRPGVVCVEYGVFLLSCTVCDRVRV